MDYPPGGAAQGHDLFALARPRTSRASTDLLINLIGGEGSNGLYRPLPHSITALRRQIQNQLHQPFVVRARAL